MRKIIKLANVFCLILRNDQIKSQFLQRKLHAFDLYFLRFRKGF